MIELSVRAVRCWSTLQNPRLYTNSRTLFKLGYLYTLEVEKTSQFENVIYKNGIDNLQYYAVN